MNYAKHYGTNTDFPNDAYHARDIPGMKSWPRIEQSLLENKKAGILYLSSNCRVQSERDDFVRRASQFMDIESPGSCFHNTEVPTQVKHLEEDANGNNLRMQWGDYSAGAHAIISLYRFRILILSSLCVDYFAEKIEQTLNAGAIPIYLGAPNSHDWDPGIAAGVHPAMIHIQDFESISELADFVNYLGRETESALSHRRRFFEYQGKEPFMFPRHGQRLLKLTGGASWESFVCQRTHDGDANRRIDVQTPCAGPWWQYMETIGKNLSLWGCTEAAPCS